MNSPRASRRDPSERSTRIRRIERTDLELWITDAILLANLSPLAKLLPAAISRAGGRISYAELEAALPTTREAIRPALAELERADLLTIAKAKRRDGRPEYAGPNRYTLAPSADSRGQASGFTRLLPIERIGRSPSRWILWTTYLREQAITGAAQLPDALAARRSGTTEGAVRVARASWKLEQVAPRGEGAPAAFVLPSMAHPPDLEKFDPRRRKLATVKAGDTAIRVWATHPQHRLIGHLLRELEDKAEAKLRQAADGHTITTANELLEGLTDLPDVWISHRELEQQFR